MSPLSEIQLVTARELRKSFRSAKGIVLGILTLGGGAGISMLFAWLDRYRRENVPPGIDLEDLHQQGFSLIYGPETGKFLAACPYSLWLMLMITVWLAPLLVALLDFDAISGELQHRSVRFWTVRIRRSSYMLGKCLGAWAAVLAVTLAMNAIVWVGTTVVGQLSFGYVLGWGLRFFLVSVPISAAWCGIAMLVGSQFKTPMLSLLVIFGAFFALWLLRIIAGYASAEWLAYLYPNFYDKLLLSPKPGDAAKGVLGTGLLAVLTTIAATQLFRRRDI